MQSHRGHERRQDRLTAQRVQFALAFKAVLNVDEAIAYMQRKNICPEVVTRVLIESKYRIAAVHNTA